MQASLPKLSRRQLLVGGGAGIGLLVAFHFWPRETAAPYRSEDGTGRFSHYLKIDPQGGITAVVPQIEYGQGIWTGFAAMIAHELGVGAGAIAVEPAPPGPGLENSAIEEAFGVSVRATAGATSVRAFEQPIRRAAATARAMLAAEAAERLDVPVEDIEVQGVDMVADGKRAAIADLAVAAASRSIPRSVSLRPWATPDISRGRVDMPAKARGAWRFAADVRLPNMLFASARLAPPNGRISAVDRAAASNRANINALVERERWIAAVSPSWWEAEGAMAAANVRYTSPAIDDAQISAALDNAIAGGRPRTISESGDARGAIAAAQGPIIETYVAAPVPPRGFEPFTATARGRSDGGIDVWCATLAPDATLAAIAGAVRLPRDKITLFPMPAGGNDGRALENPAPAIAAAIALEVERPVQLCLSPRHSAAVGHLGPPLTARIAATPGADGRLGGWHAVFAGQGGLGAALSRLAGGGASRPDVAGIVPPYGIPDLLVEQMELDLDLPVGHVASHIAGFHHFANERTVERVIRALQAEPLAYRLAMAGPRLSPLIMRAGQIAGWDGGRGSMGLACAVQDGSAMALVIDAAGTSANARVNAITAVVDAGRVIDRGLAMQVIEAGLLDGVSRTLGTAPSLTNGMAAPHSYSPALAMLPTIRIELVDSNGDPGGLSQIGASLAPAALANALGTGQNTRLRSLPFRLQGGA